MSLVCVHILVILHQSGSGPIFLGVCSFGLFKLVKSSKPTTCILDPVPSKLLNEVLPEVIDPLLTIINSSLSLGYVPKTFKLAVIFIFFKCELK